MKIRHLSAIVAAGFFAAMGANQANAHAISIGYENGGLAGLVNIWLGT